MGKLSFCQAFFKHITLACLVLTIGVAAVPLRAQNGQTDTTPNDDQHAVDVSIGRSTVVEAPWPVKRVSVAEPGVADLQVVTPGQVLVVGKSAGTTDLMFWGENDQFWQARVHVDADLSDLQADLDNLFPSADLQLSHRQKTLVVAGTFRRVEEVEQLKHFLDTAGVKYVNLTSVAGVQQVLLRVRVAEASRQIIRAMGVNFFHTDNDFFGGSTIGGNPNSINLGVPEGAIAGTQVPFVFNSETAVGAATTLFGGFPGADMQVFIQALVDNQYMRILAEPNLVALSGEQASFLAGGEFPIPVVQGSSTGGGSSITVEYKEFGVRLQFLPTVLGDGTIRLHVAPEVSDISDVGAVVIEGFSIPSVLTRRAETTLEMKSGQTFAMAGLMDRSTSARAQKVPALGNLPVLGSLFRSVRYEQGDTELVVLVTVSLVEPLSLATTGPVPGDVHMQPDDWRLFIDGQIEAKAPSKLAPADSQWLKQMGLDRLTGPGAWCTYGQQSVHVQPTTRPRPSEPTTAMESEAAPTEAAPAEAAATETSDAPPQDADEAAPEASDTASESSTQDAPK